MFIVVFISCEALCESNMLYLTAYVTQCDIIHAALRITGSHKLFTLTASINYNLVSTLRIHTLERGYLLKDCL